MKKKLEDVYNPDKQARKERVVIGLSGGIDSMVTAYLLKIQKYDLVAVTVATSWDDYAGDPSQVLSCHLSNSRLDAIRDFCNRLHIPLHIQKSAAEFKELVVEPWMADRVLAKRPKPCWSCHELRMNLIFEKMKEVGASFMATGHFCKLFRNETNGTVFVHTSNDEEHDQSALLSTVGHDILSHLLLPLSDLTKKEVLKLAENFGILREEKPLRAHECLKISDELVALLQKKVPKKFLKEGDIVSADGNANYGQHTGVIAHTYGEELVLKEDGRNIKGIFGAFVFNEKKMVMYEESFFMRNKFLLKNCRFSEDVFLPEPMRGYVQFGNDCLECWIVPKTLNSMLIELPEDRKVMGGNIFTVLKKKGKNAKVLLTGEAELLPEEKVPSEGEKSVPKSHPAIDY